MSPGRAGGRTPLAIALIASVATAVPLAAQESAVLEGRVVDGASGEGVGGDVVELHRVTRDGGTVLDSARTLGDGSFRFPIPPPADEAGRPIYLVGARHQGILYFGRALHEGPEVDRPYEVPVYDTMAVGGGAESEAVRVTGRYVVVSLATTGAGSAAGFDVAEVVDLAGPADRTLVPSGTAALWSTELPRDAEDAAPLRQGIAAAPVEIEGRTVAVRTPLSPTGLRVAYGYRLSGEELLLRFDRLVERVEVVAADPGLEVEGAAFAGTETRSGRPVRTFEALAVEPGDEIRVRGATDPDADRWALVWAAIGIALSLAAFAVWRSAPSQDAAQSGTAGSEG